MAVYLVTWNLNGEGAAYNAKRARFVQLLDAYENRKDPGLESVRFVASYSTAKAISDALAAGLDGNDCLVVTQMAPGAYYGLLQPDVWRWIAEKQ